MITGVRIGDATAAGRNAVEPAFVERFEKRQDRPRPCDRLSVDKLLATAELTGGNVVLNADNHHRDDFPGLGNAGRFGHHAHPHDLSFDLPKAGGEDAPPRAFRNQDAG